MRGRSFAMTRRAALAAMMIALSLAGHAAGSSRLPDMTGLLLGLALTAALASTASPRRMSWPALLVFVFGVQALLHVVFVLSDGCPLRS